MPVTQQAGPSGSTAVTTGEPDDDGSAAVVRDRGDAEAYVASVCFKHGPPLLTGVELEWLVRPCSSDRTGMYGIAPTL